MYQINDLLVYGTRGICMIEDIVERTVDDSVGSYYVIRPLVVCRSVIYLPTQNLENNPNIRGIITKEEAQRLLDELSDSEPLWFADSIRRERYKDIITRGERKELLRMIITLTRHKKKQMKFKKRLHISDERFLADAENILYGEIAYLLGMSYAEVKEKVLAQADMSEE